MVVEATGRGTGARAILIGGLLAARVLWAEAPAEAPGAAAAPAAEASQGAKGAEAPMALSPDDPARKVLRETASFIDLLLAAGESAAAELRETLKDLLDRNRSGAAAPATSFKPDNLGCTLDPTAFRLPFNDSTVINDFDIKLKKSADRVILARLGTGEERTLETSPGGLQARAAGLRPDQWTVTAVSPTGERRCVFVEVAAGPAPACPAEPEGTRACTALTLARQWRFSELAALNAQDKETRLIIAAAACAEGHVPGDLLAGDGRSCAEVRGELGGGR